MEVHLHIVVSGTVFANSAKSRRLCIFGSRFTKKKLLLDSISESCPFVLCSMSVCSQNLNRCNLTAQIGVPMGENHGSHG